MSRSVTLDGLRVHPSAGFLSKQIARRYRPRQAVAAQLTPTVLPEVTIFCPANNIDTPLLRGIILAKAYSSFYPMDDEASSGLGMAAGLASMLSNMLAARFVERDGELAAAFMKAGGSLRKRELHTEEQVRALLNDRKVAAFFDKFEQPAYQLFLENRDQQILCIGILLLTLGKDVNPDNYDGWIKNRLRTFQGALGISPDKCCWTEAQCPPQESLTDCYRFLSASFTLRRLMFLICVSGARDTSRFAAVFREVLIFLQGVEMGHILMIDKYIFSKYPELLRIRSLRDNMAAMNTAWEYLASVEEDERFFVKILYDRSATAALNRQNFTLLATAAISAAQFETPSMRFYRGGNVTATSGTVGDIVTQYLTLRMNLAYMAMPVSPYAAMSEEEKQKYMAQYAAAETGASLFTLPMPGERREDAIIPVPRRDQ